MDLRLEQTGPGDFDEVAAFLREMFRAPADAPFVEPRHAHWKYYEPRPDWEGSRSYVFREQGNIVTHGCVAPATFAPPGGDAIKSIYVIDWAASPSVPGSGVLLLKEIAAFADIRFGYGGSEAAKAIVRNAHAGKHVHERTIGEIMWARRSFRPWAPLRDRTAPAWKALARAGRNLWRNASRPSKSCGGWKARPIERFDAQLPDLRGSSQAGLTLPVRTPELLNYMLDCPSVHFSGFLLEKHGSIRGHLLLADHGEEIRLADLAIDSDAPEDWVACYSLAVSTAKRNYPLGGHLRATAAPKSLQSALLQAGFAEEGREPLLAQGGLSVLPPGHAPVLNMIDSDAAYLP